MKDLKWYQKMAGIILLILCLPVILVVAVAGALFNPKRKRDYKKSRYYRDLKVKYTWSKPISAEYRFYNRAVRRGLPMEYVRQPSNGLEYVIHDGTLFLFPDFFTVWQNGETGAWVADYDREEKPFEQSFRDLTAKLDTPSDLPMKLLVERDMIHVTDLNTRELPTFVHLIPSFEDAFEPVDLSLLKRAPQTTAELYNMMKSTADLCGEYELTSDGALICWNLYKNVRVEISVEPEPIDCFLGVYVQLDGKEEGITHWHPTQYAIYHEICRMGKRGNVLVLCTQGASGWVAYVGDKEGCPYSPEAPKNHTKTYYLEAR